MATYTFNVSTGAIDFDPDFVAPSFASEIIINEVTESQFMRAAVKLGLVGAQEAEAYMGRGELPAMMENVLALLPEAQRIDARLKAVGATKFYRDDEIFAAMSAAGVYTNEQIDAVFRLAATL